MPGFDDKTNFGLLPELGFSCCELSNVAQRQFFLGSQYNPDESLGCLVFQVHPFSPATTLIKVDDVLVAVDGRPISEKAEVLFRGHEWLPFDWVVSKKSFGDEISVTLLRKAENTGAISQHDVKITLTDPKHLVPRLLGVDLTPNWCILGGLVFVVLSHPLMDQCDKTAYGHLYWLLRHDTKAKEEEEIVICGDVLSSFTNATYNKFKFSRLKSVNGISILNLKHLSTIVRGIRETSSDKIDVSSSSSSEDLPPPPSPSPFIEVEFCGDKDARWVAIFDRNAVWDAEAEIMGTHKVPSRTSFFEDAE